MSPTGEPPSQSLQQTAGRVGFQEFIAPAGARVRSLVVRLVRNPSARSHVWRGRAPCSRSGPMADQRLDRNDVAWVNGQVLTANGGR